LIIFVLQNIIKKRRYFCKLKSTAKYYIFALICLTIGSFTYLIRPSETIAFGIIHNYFGEVSILCEISNSLRISDELAETLIFRLIFGYLSDAMWFLSLVFILLGIWSKQKIKIIVSLVLLVAIVLELLQLGESNTGVFDIFDIVLYVLLSVMLLLSIKNQKE
jgi:hypothetical protein